MNFMERLEEGISEDSSDITRHMRVSTYRKGQSSGTGEDPSASFLTESTNDDMSQSLDANGQPVGAASRSVD